MMICLECTVRIVKQTGQVHYLRGRRVSRSTGFITTRWHSLVRHVTMWARAARRVATV